MGELSWQQGADQDKPPVADLDQTRAEEMGEMRGAQVKADGEQKITEVTEGEGRAKDPLTGHRAMTTTIVVGLQQIQSKGWGKNSQP